MLLSVNEFLSPRKEAVDFNVAGLCTQVNMKNVTFDRDVIPFLVTGGNGLFEWI
jgi:hypothetical protein